MTLSRIPRRFSPLLWLRWLCLVAAVGALSAAERAPQVQHVGLVAADVLGITITAGQANYGRQIPYTRQAGDIVAENEIHRFVRRGGKIIGTLVGKKGDLLCTMDEVVGEKLDTARADQPESYGISSADDPRYGTAQKPAAVYRKSKPSDLAMIGVYQFEAPAQHVLYLKLPAPLQSGKTYRVSFSFSQLTACEFVFDPVKLRSEAVHVNQIGFRPDDPAKVAFLSCWLGNGGALHYPAGLPFRVVEDATGRPVFAGATVLSKAADDQTEDAYHKNYNGADVFQMDFSALDQPGKYRVCVESIGCSYPFELGAEVWRKAFATSARGFYHQRSGIALGPPYTTYTRPRTFHPEDGLKVYASRTPIMDTGNGLNQKDSNFGNLVKGKTDELVPNAWGGYMDAGDWDRRIQHLKSTLLLLELAELFPDYFAGLSLNIPESGNGLPDIVNEALFNLDFFRRLQLPEGGVRGGIESSEHPRRGEASFQESLTVMAYAPDIFSSYVYAGVAARAARWLAAREAARAAVYRESALRAMRWAESDRDREEKEFLMAKHPAVRDARNYAAAELFRLTGESRWNELFLATTLFAKTNAPVPMNWDSLDQGDSAWVYARTGQPGTDAAVKQHCREVLLREADDRLASIERTAFHWAKHPYGPVVYGVLSSPEYCVNVVRAHVLTANPKYLRAAVLASQTGAGANPVNLCYTTGLGCQSPQHPLQLDHRITHQAPPPGITVGGPMDNTLAGLKDPFIGPFAGTVFHPAYPQWPALEAYWDVFWDPMVCEYTVHKPMAGTAYVWGYLAARGKLPQTAASADTGSQVLRTDWLKDAQLGVFVHFLPADAATLARVNDFDVEALARQLNEAGARYFVLTLGQNSGYFNAPNAVYDRLTGYQPGERCSRRDLPLELYRALQPKGIRLMLYLPCQTPNQDARAQKAFGLPQGPKDQPIDAAFARKWAEVIHEWAARYGDKVAGWWFDGGYAWVGFNEEIARLYADAVKRGNPSAIVTFNPGVSLIRHTQAEDYTAGELNEPFATVPSSRWVKGSQWHALTFLGSNWSQRNTRYPTERWREWFQKVAAKEGVITLDLGPNWNPAAGPIGALAEAQLAQVKALRVK